MSEKLKSLLTDLSNNPDLEQDYKNDPKKVMSRYNLNEDEKTMLLNEDTKSIETALSGDGGGSSGSIQKIIKLT